MNHANLTVVFTTSDHVPMLLNLKPKVPMLRMIVTVDKITSDAAKLLKAWANSLDIVFQELADCEDYLRILVIVDSNLLGCLVEAYGKANVIDPIPAYPELVVSICYTSVHAIQTEVARLRLTLL
jgi:long-chain acyl-CoA synthetase